MKRTFLSMLAAVAVTIAILPAPVFACSGTCVAITGPVYVDRDTAIAIDFTATIAAIERAADRLVAIDAQRQAASATAGDAPQLAAAARYWHTWPPVIS